jgi:hypothetical protein
MGRPRNLSKDHVADAQAKITKRRRVSQRGGSLRSLVRRLRDADVISADDETYILDGSSEACRPEDLHSLVRLQVALPLALFAADELSAKDLTVALNKASTQMTNLLNAQTEDEQITSVHVDANVPTNVVALFGGGDVIEVH